MFGSLGRKIWQQTVSSSTLHLGSVAALALVGSSVVVLQDASSVNQQVGDRLMFECCLFYVERNLSHFPLLIDISHFTIHFFEQKRIRPPPAVLLHTPLGVAMPPLRVQ